MHILVTGGTGFIGQALVPALQQGGHTVTVLSRQALKNREGLSYVKEFDEIRSPVDAVINLAGASLADRRWSDTYKAEMVASRVGTTDRLVAWMSQQATPPGVLLSGSAIGWYGASEDAVFDEKSPPGSGFAAELCQQWESAAEAAVSLGTRVALLRLGVVFDRDGGALQEMLRSFKFGVGSWLGSGHQWLSWVHRWDVVRSMLFLLEDSRARGAYNIVAPEAVTHRQFCDIASGRRPTLFSMGVPGFVARALVGEMAEELLLSGQHVAPVALTTLGYQFEFPGLDGALVDIQAKETPRRSLG
jgi:uncharacterized protein (TIGR01777 family)